MTKSNHKFMGIHTKKTFWGGPKIIQITDEIIHLKPGPKIIEELYTVIQGSLLYKEFQGRTMCLVAQSPSAGWFNRRMVIIVQPPAPLLSPPYQTDHPTLFKTCSRFQRCRDLAGSPSAQWFISLELDWTRFPSISFSPKPIWSNFMPYYKTRFLATQNDIYV